jgi:hypothetical protein
MTQPKQRSPSRDSKPEKQGSGSRLRLVAALVEECWVTLELGTEALTDPQSSFWQAKILPGLDQV